LREWIALLGVSYLSPSQGLLEFSWSGDLLQDSTAVNLKDYPRYGNPYADAPFPGEGIRFEHDGHWLDLDWQTLERNSSGFLGDG
jgi:hypothetical protein